MAANSCEVSLVPTADSPPEKCQKMNRTEMEEFDAVFSDLLDSLTKTDVKNKVEIEEAITWFKEVSSYNVPFGKKNRGMSVLMSYELMKPKASEEDMRLARILGWCVEWLQAFFLIADDVMDKSYTRRGKPCWYKKEGVGLTAVNDAIYLEACVYQILRNNFRGKPYYTDLLELFHEVTLQTITGQCLDMITSPEGQINFDKFTLERYTAIVKWKTAFYSFYLPVALAMHMDDYLDCYGDPTTIGKIGTDIEENKCSWLIVQALDRVDSEQRQVLLDNYGRNDTEKVARVKSLYEDLNLTKLYQDYEESSYQQLLTDIESYTGSVPKEVFIKFANKIYKRNK